ncbi:MFS transporter [Paraburkholderia sp. CNPSo 3157]|uniref:MFS transporter n=1 Tax=Paraburkholderia franconis TaxID=2654983 RepID=A0A7X1TK63_9BURK|nr:MFS transporter [Paraburkholderia franconis]MPW22256.1 MFS transporter [Paraburkholderia franconis]
MDGNAWQGAAVEDDAHAHPASAVDATFRKVTLHLIPFLFICYVAAYLDRINVGFAQLQMRQDLAFSDAVYGLGAGIFFAGYFLFEVPSNLLLERVGARKTLVRIMLLWGATSACMMFVQSPAMFYVMRFLLGVFEAGFFPGMILYLTYWYPANRRGRVMALFLTAVAIAGVVGGPVSGWALNHLDGVRGLKGWQWLFLTQGLPSCVLGIAAFFYLDDRPHQARWLSATEKAILRDSVQRDQGASLVFQRHSFGEALKVARVYSMAFTWFTFICGVYAISFWLPSLIKGAGVSDAYSIGMLSAIPYCVAALTMVCISRHSDRAVERRWHAAICAAIGAITLAAIPRVAGDLVLSLAVVSAATAAIFTLQPLFWAIATDYLGGTRAAAGTIAFINSLGLIGGFVSPTILGWVKSMTGSLANGLYVVATLLLAGAIVTLRFRRRSGV